MSKINLFNTADQINQTISGSYLRLVGNCVAPFSNNGQFLIKNELQQSGLGVSSSGINLYTNKIIFRSAGNSCIESSSSYLLASGAKSILIQNECGAYISDNAGSIALNTACTGLKIHYCKPFLTLISKNLSPTIQDFRVRFTDSSNFNYFSFDGYFLNSNPALNFYSVCHLTFSNSNATNLMTLCRDGVYLNNTYSSVSQNYVLNIPTSRASISGIDMRSLNLCCQFCVSDSNYNSSTYNIDFNTNAVFRRNVVFGGNVSLSGAGTFNFSSNTTALTGCFQCARGTGLNFCSGYFNYLQVNSTNVNDCFKSFINSCFDCISCFNCIKSLNTNLTGNSYIDTAYVNNIVDYGYLRVSGDSTLCGKVWVNPVANTTHCIQGDCLCISLTNASNALTINNNSKINCDLTVSRMLTTSGLTIVGTSPFIHSYAICSSGSISANNNISGTCFVSSGRSCFNGICDTGSIQTSSTIRATGEITTLSNLNVSGNLNLNGSFSSRNTSKAYGMFAITNGTVTCFSGFNFKSMNRYTPNNNCGIFGICLNTAVYTPVAIQVNLFNNTLPSSSLSGLNAYFATVINCVTICGNVGGLTKTNECNPITICYPSTNLTMPISEFCFALMNCCGLYTAFSGLASSYQNTTGTFMIYGT
jgi:hypothetical protein